MPWNFYMHNRIHQGGGGGGSLPMAWMENVPDALEKNAEKGLFSGVDAKCADRELGCQIAKIGKKRGIQIAMMIRVLAVRLNVEIRVKPYKTTRTLIFTSNQRKKISEIKPQICVSHKNACTNPFRSVLEAKFTIFIYIGCGSWPVLVPC